MNTSKTKDAKLIWMWLSICTVILSPLVWIFIKSPRGEDVQNALTVKAQIEKILMESDLPKSRNTNLVLMQHARNELITVIQNPTPNPEEVFKRIERKSDEINGSRLKVVFINNYTEKIKIMYLNLPK